MENSPGTQSALTASRLRIILSVVLVGMVLAALTGCGFSGSAIAVHAPVALRGTVLGGQRPVTGARIQLYSAGTNGVGSAALPLLSSPVTSDGAGNFTIPASYRCPALSSQVYVVARGGNPGLSSGADNPALALTAMLGSCDSLSPSMAISLNEVTTVGSVWPLAPFMTSPTDLGSSPGDTDFIAATSVSGNSSISTKEVPRAPPRRRATSPRTQSSTVWPTPLIVV